MLFGLHLRTKYSLLSINVDNSTINSNVCLHVHLPESPAKLKYVKFNYTEKNQVRSTCIEWNDSTLVNDIVCYVVIGCNVQVAVVTALGDVNVTSEWMSVPTNPCPIDGPDITTIGKYIGLRLCVCVYTVHIFNTLKEIPNLYFLSEILAISNS